MTLAERIKTAMGDRTRSEFARACDVSPAAVTLWLKGDIKSLKAETASVIERATGYRANWIVRGVGPRKVGEENPTGEDYWPFTQELKRAILTLKDEQRLQLENIVRAVVGLTPLEAINSAKPTNSLNVVTQQRAYPDRKEAGALDPFEVPSTKHVPKANRRSAREKRDGGSRGHA